MATPYTARAPLARDPWPPRRRARRAPHPTGARGSPRQHRITARIARCLWTVPQSITPELSASAEELMSTFPAERSPAHGNTTVVLVIVLPQHDRI